MGEQNPLSVMIQNKMEKDGLNRLRFAQMCGVSYPSLCRAVSSKGEKVGMKTFAKIAEFCGVPVLEVADEFRKYRAYLEAMLGGFALARNVRPEQACMSDLYEIIVAIPRPITVEEVTFLLGEVSRLGCIGPDLAVQLIIHFRQNKMATWTKSQHAAPTTSSPEPT